MSGSLIRAVAAPSNIALIKYMGKKDARANLPENGSLSMTLNDLCSVLEIRAEQGTASRGGAPRTITWIPELPAHESLPALGSGLKFHPPKLSEKGIARMVAHIERVRGAVEELFPRFGLKVSAEAKAAPWVLRSANSFPEASGIASSASSFAAMTLATAYTCAADAAAFERAWAGDRELRWALARLSRQGSGSSCRSLEGPWVYWEDEDARALETKMPAMAHFVIVVSEAAKRVSSSEAHLQVATSPLWAGRVSRVNDRIAALKTALATADVAAVARIAWAEAWEMHSLFHTSATPFSYWEPETLYALQELSPMMNEAEPPIVTLDAGPNIHVIVPASKREAWKARLDAMIAGRPGVRLLQDSEGTGARLIGSLASRCS